MDILPKISLILFAIFAIGAMKVADAQSSTTQSCAANLASCGQYLSSTKPPSSCCTPLKQTVETQLQCLCDLFYKSDILQQLKINTTQALQLSRNCGITQGIDSCKESKAPSPSGPPTATPGHDIDNDASRVAFNGISFLVLFWASMLFN